MLPALFRPNEATPKPADDPPPATDLDGQTGVSPLYARQDHTHAARIQRTIITSSSAGEGRWVFARPILCPTGKAPPVAYMVEDAGTPVIVQTIGRVFTATAKGDLHTEVSFKAQRSRFVPALVASLAGTLGFDLFAGVASGVKISLFAADPTQERPA